MALQKDIHRLIGINPNDVICENPYFQHKDYRYSGCQIDYMIQTKFDTLYVCEIKFSKHKIGFDIINEVQRKIDTLKHSKRFSCRPVLIHVNGVDEDVADSDYFASIVDASDLLVTTP